MTDERPSDGVDPRSVRVAVVAGVPLPNLGPLFAQLHRRAELELKVLYATGMGTGLSTVPLTGLDKRIVWDVNALAGYEHERLWWGDSPDPRRPLSVLGGRLWSKLSPDRVDVVVIFGWQYPANVLAALLCRARGIPYLLYSDVDVRNAGRTKPAWLRSRLIQSICRGAAGAMFMGTFNRDFYIRHGVAAESLWFTPWAVDNDRFGAVELSAVGRRDLNLRADTVYFLGVGKLIQRKRWDLFLDCVTDLQREGHDVGALICGDGPMAGEIRRQVRRRGTREVHELGFVNQSGLPTVYAAADVFVLCSDRDPRAAVVNEAMASGLPVVTTKAAGMWGPGDLLRSGREGIVVERSCRHSLTAAMRQLLDERSRTEMGQAAKSRVGKWSYARAVDGWVEAITAVSSRAAESTAIE